MKSFFCLIFAIALLSLASFGQTPASSQPDLSGTWEIEKGMGPLYKNRVMQVRQESDRVIIVETFEFEGRQYSHNLTLYPDGRGEQNRIAFPENKTEAGVQSRTSWKKGKLIRKSSYDVPIPLFGGSGITFHSQDTDTYSVNKDGQLVFESSSMITNAPNGPSLSNIKRIYRKKS